IASSIGIFKKNRYIFWMTFSILGNISFLLNAGSRMFIFYHVVWIQYIAIFFWPFINIFLIIKYFKEHENN
ncbi:MAG: hypothetical protein COW50_01820, partial [Candidatus Moranbacteria bacterium CG17_big_fil_post_rev_8_21_14_2_50_41_107]